MLARNLSRTLKRASQRSLANTSINQAPKPTDSFVQGLYTNRLILDHVHPYPEVLNQDQIDDLGMYVDSTTSFFEEVNDADANDANATIGEEAWEGAKELGAFGILVPEEYEGLGMNNTEYARLSEILISEDAGFSIAIGAHQSIGYKAILILGNDEQKAKYLPDLATGRKIAAFALTEPSTGSDASSVQCRAEKTADGKHYILNGSKIWISNGGIADVFTVFAKTAYKDPNTGETKDKMNAFIVERAFGGLSHGPPEKKMGIKASNTAEVYFEDVKIPAENLIAEEGQGFKVAMEVLNNGRFGMATGLCGVMKKCINQATDHAANRKQFFNTTIDNYGAIQEKLARMSMLHYAAESMGYLLCGSMDNKAQDYGLEAACCKIFASEAAWWCCDEAIQVLGGMGYMRDTGLERVMRDLRIFRIFEGTNDILRIFIALTGMKHQGDTLDDVKNFQKDLKNMNIKGIMKAKAWKDKHDSKELMEGSLIHAFGSSLRGEAAMVEEIMRELQYVSGEILMKYQKKIINGENQMMVRKLADVTISLYSQIAVLSRCSRALSRGDDSAEHELLMAQSWIQDQNDQCKNWLKQARGYKGLHANFTKISQNVVEKGGVVQEHVLGC